MGLPQHRPLTLDDYFGTDDDARWELIDGQTYDMSPAPTLRHQSLSGRAYVSLVTSLRVNRAGPPAECRVFAAPVDVVLNPNTVVQPDIIVAEWFAEK